MSSATAQSYWICTQSNLGRMFAETSNCFADGLSVPLVAFVEAEGGGRAAGVGSEESHDALVVSSSQHRTVPAPHCPSQTLFFVPKTVPRPETESHTIPLSCHLLAIEFQVVSLSSMVIWNADVPTLLRDPLSYPLPRAMVEWAD